MLIELVLIIVYDDYKYQLKIVEDGIIKIYIYFYQQFLNIR